jgi:hypothetical protein
MNSLRVLILLGYYNRPILVRNALKSILKAHEHHDNWELAFGDDGSDVPGKPIVEEILKDHLDKVRFYHSGLRFEDKIENGLILGMMANRAIRESKADIGILLCDDDELVPTYLRGLSDYFLANPKVMYCYSKIHLYNPFFNVSEQVDNVTGRYNKFDGPINPVNKVDATQVAWRLACQKEHDAWLVDTTKFVDGMPWSKDTDKSFFEVLYKKFGEAQFSGLVGQYKGIHDYQLLWHKDVPAAHLWAYDKMCKELGGKVF